MKHEKIEKLLEFVEGAAAKYGEDEEITGVFLLICSKDSGSVYNDNMSVNEIVSVYSGIALEEVMLDE